MTSPPLQRRLLGYAVCELGHRLFSESSSRWTNLTGVP